MRYLQCKASFAQADDAEQAWLDARAVAECRYDIDGHLVR